MKSIFVSNLIYVKLTGDFLGFVDTGGGFTFLFRNKELLPKLTQYTHFYRKEELLEHYPKNIVLFIGQDFFWNKIVNFNYPKKQFKELKKMPTNVEKFKLYRDHNNSFSHVDVVIDDKSFKLLFDTGATRLKNGKRSATSFLDGSLFDKLAKKYKTIPKYDDDGQPGIVIPEIVLFNNRLKNVKFLRRDAGNFSGWMSKITKIKHIGAIGGNVLKHFNIVVNFKTNLFAIY